MKWHWFPLGYNGRKEYMNICWRMQRHSANSNLLMFICVRTPSMHCVGHSSEAANLCCCFACSFCSAAAAAATVLTRCTARYFHCAGVMESYWAWKEADTSIPSWPMQSWQWGNLWRSFAVLDGFSVSDTTGRVVRCHAAYRFPHHIVIVDLMCDMEGSLVCSASGNQKYIDKKKNSISV